MLQLSDYIASASAVVALCALGVSFWQGYVTRAHARLSVRPHVEIHFGIQQKGTLSIEAVNTGIGPAFIAKVGVNVGNDVVILGSAADSRRLARLLAGDTPEYNLRFLVPDATTAVSAGGRVLLLEMAPLEGNAVPWMGTAEATMQQLSSLSAFCEYKCMYGTTLTSRTGRSAA